MEWAGPFPSSPFQLVHSQEPSIPQVLSERTPWVEVWYTGSCTQGAAKPRRDDKALAGAVRDVRKGPWPR